MTRSSKRTLVIGDIHGCFEELCRLLDKASLGGDDDIVALGDILDRGPNPGAVIDFFNMRSDARSLIGNHEHEHIRCFHLGEELDLAQQITRGQLGEQYSQACDCMSRFDLYLDLPKALLVHGFYEPGLPLSQQEADVLIGTTAGEQHLHAKYKQPWYELYDGRKPIIVGHRNHLRNGQPFVYRDLVFCIDTGCYWGDRLTGLILPEFQFVSVKATQDHWRDVKRRNMDICMKPMCRHHIDWALLDDALSDTFAAQHAKSPVTAVSRDLQRMADDASLQINNLHDLVLKEHNRVLVHLCAAHCYDLLPPDEQAAAYSEHLGDTPFTHLLHIARRGYMTPQYLRNYFEGPYALEQFMADGIPPAAHD